MILPALLAASLAQIPPLPEPLRLVRELHVAIDRDGGRARERTVRASLARRPQDPAAVLAVATFERARYRYERSDSLLRPLAIADGRVGPAWRAMAQMGMAAWRSLGSEPGRADSLLVAARAVAHSANLPAIEAEAVLGLAQLRQRSQGVKVGQQLLGEWWALLPRPTPPDSAQRLCLTGAIAEQLGDSTGYRLIAAGAKIAERVGAWRVAGNCRLAAAQTSERRGTFLDAIDSARLALEHFTAVKYDVGVALASQWFGYALVQENRFAEGRLMLEQAIVAARTTRFASVEAWAHSGLAEMYLSLGDLGQARSHAAIAAASHAVRGDRWGVANSRQFEAAALEASGELRAAADRYAEAQSAFVAAGLPLNALPALAARAGVLLRLGQLDSAEQVLATAATLGRSTEGARSEQNVLRAGLALRRGQLALADSLLRLTGMSRGWREGSTRYTAITVAAREAQVALRRERPAVADSALSAVTNALSAWRRTPQNTGIVGSLAQLRDNWGALTDVYPDLVAQLASRGRVPVAFELVEHLRAREIVERTRRSAALLVDPTAVERALHSARGAASVVTLGALQRALGADEAFVSYTLGLDDTPSTAIIVTRDSVASRVVPGRNALLADIQRFVQLAAAGTEGIASSRRLGSALLAPVLATLPRSITRMILSPDGELHRVPFDALRLPDGRLGVERSTISLAPSATALLAMRARAPAPGTTLVAFGDPRYASRSGTTAERPVPSRERGSAPFTGVALPRLRYSGDEAKRVARYGRPGRVLLAGAASEEAAMRTDWRDVGVVHFATHALVNSESQVGTALALAPGANTDGFLTPGEVAQLQFNAPLVVLSACRSSGGQLLAGEGLRGLTAPLLGAGARAVVATHWSIGDRSVLPFVDRFYAAMASGLRVDDALRQAKLAAIRDGVSIADWGSYAVIGDGAMRVALRPPALAPVAWLRNVTQSLRDTSGT